MKAYAVVEGIEDRDLLVRLLPQDVRPQVTVVPAGERTSLTSVARTLLVTKGAPLAVLMDADTVETSAVSNRRRQTEELLQAMSGGVPFRVFVTVPELEALLFATPTAIERITGQPVSADHLAIARYEPKRILLQLGQNSRGVVARVIDGLTPEEVDVLRAVPPMKELIDFLAGQVTRLPQAQPA